MVTGYFDLVVDEHPKGRDIRFQPHPHLSGRDGGRTINLRQLALDGVTLHSHLLDANETLVTFSDDLASSLDAADKFCQENMEDIDEFVAKNGLDAPDSDHEVVEWQPPAARASLDLNEAGITTVIYATGFHYNFAWINLPVLDDRGYPRYERGVTKLPGFYFVGLHWMYTQGSGLFYQVGRDAEFVVDHLIRNGV